MAGQQPLTLPIGVRVPVSQPLLGNSKNPVLSYTLFRMVYA